jgi:hypothetical protein
MSTAMNVRISKKKKKKSRKFPDKFSKYKSFKVDPVTLDQTHVYYPRSPSVMYFEGGKQVFQLNLSDERNTNFNLSLKML